MRKKREVKVYCLPLLCWQLYKNKQFEFTKKEFENVLSDLKMSCVTTRFARQLTVVDADRSFLNNINIDFVLKVSTSYINIIEEKATVNNFFCENTYVIKHHYYRDFFIAVYVINEMCISNSVPDVMEKELLPPFIQALVGDVLGEHYNVPLIKDNFWSVNHFSQTPLHGVLREISKKNGRSGYALENIFNIWKRSRKGYLVGESFEKIDLSGVNLNGCVFSVRDKNKTHGSNFIKIRNPIKLDQFLTEGHLGVVTFLDFNPAYKMLASASTDCTIKIWNVEGEVLRLYRTLHGHLKPVKRVIFSKNGKKVLSCSVDGSVRQWDFETGAAEVLYESKSAIDYFDIDFDERYILMVVCNYRKIIEMDILTKELTEYAGHTGRVNMATYIPDGIMSCSDTGEVYRWNRADHTVSYKYGKEKNSVKFVCYGCKTDKVFAAMGDGEIIVYNQSGERQVFSGESRKAILYLKMNEDEDKLLTCGDDRMIHEWSIEYDQLKELACIKGHGGSVNCAVYNGDGDRIYSGSWDNTIQVWESLIGININKITGTRYWTNHLYVNKSEQKMLVSCWNGDIQEWDIPRKKCIQIYRGHTNVVCKAIYNENETRILSCSYDKTIREWDVSTGSCIHVLQGHEDCVIDVKYCENENFIISGSYDKKILKWRKKLSQYEYDVIGEHLDYVNGIQYNESIHCILSWSDDGYVSEWNLENMRTRKYSLKNFEIKYAAYINDNEILFVSWYGVIGKIHKNSGQIECLHKFGKEFGQIVYACYFKDSCSVYICDSNNNLWKFHLSTGNVDLELQFDHIVESLFISHFSAGIYAGGWGRTIYHVENKKAENFLPVSLGLYIGGCEFENCRFEDEHTQEVISYYDGHIMQMRREFDG